MDATKAVLRIYLGLAIELVHLLCTLLAVASSAGAYDVLRYIYSARINGAHHCLRYDVLWY